MRRRRSPRREGFTILAVGVTLIAVIGITGLAVDLGRMYVVRSELQAFADAASVNGALQLDGTSDGIARANVAVSDTSSGTNPLKWDFGTKTVTAFSTRFAKGYTAQPNTPDPATWNTNPINAADYRFIEVATNAPVPLTFMAAFKSLQSGAFTSTSNVAASSVAAQALITQYPQGLLPFSPIGHSSTPDNFGLTPGVQFTLRYPAPQNNVEMRVCAGDVGQAYIDQLPSEDRGFWGSTSSAELRGEILNTEQTQPILIGDPVPMVGGNKNTEANALATRVMEDSDYTSTTYADYIAAGRGNGRRIIGVPINSGPPDFIAVGVGAFFLLTADVYNAVGGNDPICSEYIGPYVQGSRYQGAGATAATGNTGGYIVRLIQ